jgi:hypothetical protein
MARSTLTDYLQVYPFWLFDVAPVELLSLPLFTPILGFSGITTPEMSLEVFPVNEANWLFTKKVIKGGSVGTVSIRRGSHWIDSDFYKWILAAVQGDTGGLGSIAGAYATALGGVTPRRDLLLIHFMSRSPFGDVGTRVAASVGLAAITGISAAAVGGGTSVAQVASIGLAAGTAAAGGRLGPFEFAARIPAKAWMLYGCVPVRYKPGSDFEASDGSVSVAELDIEVDYFDEIGLAA